MDFQSVQSPTNYGAPNVFQQGQGQGGQQQQGQQGQPGQQPQQGQLAAVLQKAKQMLSQGLISADQYNGIASKMAPDVELSTSAGNMGSSMGAGAPMNILPGG